MSNKNYLVFKNYKISDHTKWYDDRSEETNLVENYNKMEKIAVESAMKNLKGMNEIKIFRGEAENIRDVFKKNFFEIYELWQKGNNILYADLDVVFINKENYFSGDLFRMYNITQPHTTKDEHYGVEFEHFFNCGIRYYPSTMSQDVWDVGIEMVNNWNPDRWDCEQVIYNQMMWSQDIDVSDVYSPQHAYQCLVNPQIQDGSLVNKQFNQIDIGNAYAVHVHGSRGSSDRLTLMDQLHTGKIPLVQEVLYL